MCGGGGAGGGGADLGNAAGIAVGSGFGGYEAGATNAAIADPGGGVDPGTSMIGSFSSMSPEAAIPAASMSAGGLTPGQQLSQQVGKNVAKAAGIVIPGVGTILGLMDHLGAFDGPPGSVPGDIGGTGPGGLGGPSGKEFVATTPRAAGPPVAPRPRSEVGFSTLEPIAPETVQVGSPFSVERGRTPAEIDAANRLRAAREAAYAKQRADAEAELLRTLGLRDVAYTGGLNSRFATQPPASERFVGKPPALGQSRHYWP